MLIAISQRNDKNKHGDWVDGLENNYINYFEKFGIRLLLIPNAGDIASYFDKLPVRGLILTGGNEINPGEYGGKSKTGSFSKARDLTEKRLLDIAIKKKLPILGVCRGSQMINVYFNGSLIENVKEHVKKNHVAVNHPVNIVEEHARKLLGERIEVNSYHNMGISTESLSSELRPFAQSPDGLVEGLFHPTLPIAAVIWHPERKSPDERANEKLIKAFTQSKLFWE